MKIELKKKLVRYSIMFLKLKYHFNSSVVCVLKCVSYMCICVLLQVKRDAAAVLIQVWCYVHTMHTHVIQIDQQTYKLFNRTLSKSILDIVIVGSCAQIFGSDELSQDEESCRGDTVSLESTV